MECSYEQASPGLNPVLVVLFSYITTDNILSYRSSFMKFLDDATVFRLSYRRL